MTAQGPPIAGVQLVEPLPAIARKRLVTGDPLREQQTLDEVSSADDFERAFNEISQHHLQGVVLTQDGLFNSGTPVRERISRLALEHNLPMIAYTKPMAVDGALLSYGPDNPAIFRRAGVFIDKILKGAKPTDLPVEQPSKFEFFINMKTAKELGLTMPPSLLARADGVVE